MQDFTLIAGETKLIDVTVRDPLTQDAVAITDATIVWQAFHSKGRTVVLTKSTGAGTITITDATNGVFRITLSASDTAALTPKDYVWAIKLTFSDTTVIRRTGVMRVEPAYGT